MLASPKTLAALVNHFGKVEMVREAEGWVDDTVAVEMSKEDLKNLQALARTFPTLQVTEKQLNGDEHGYSPRV